MAMAAASSTAPPMTGSPYRAICRITVSEAARPSTEVWVIKSGKAARPTIANRARAVSMTTTPAIMPITACRAAFSSRAEKNF